MSLPSLRQLLRAVLTHSSAARRLAVDLASMVFRAQARARAELVHAPFTLYNIELTNHCPMRCVMCPRTHAMTRPKGVMEFALFREVVDQLVAQAPKGLLASQPVWLHHFGESLLHPELDRCVAYAESRGLRTGLSLNPLLLSEDKGRALLKAGVSTLYCSLDGHDDASFAAIRGVKEAYESSAANLSRFLEIRQELGAKAEVFVSIIDFELNAASVELARRRWKDVPGVRAVYVKPFTPWDGSVEAISEISGNASAAVLDFTSKGLVTCPYPWRSMTVAYNGDVLPCCFDFDGKYVLGNMGSASLAEIWNSPRMIALRREFLANRVCNPLCARCGELRTITI
ncbi:S-adenosyl-L-methionine-dependent 2-deoxy-scyllo-inosamine dehydrogenase [Fundidesulfovibrio magnetotacticus]|uniref:S-adenosyl-L-methionine-dependent 2-deoxy-scyllo-inosamine dehydrogenase n=1 Tax=Fundidesulfovibrio magnetotacticus TaxID=2730080 RepID=A0A6V8LNI2_9BACT|nr:radical SAM/SPASM domain-containing protein [Fundidesulfovibrio magnetotacticus]GFK94173.1 S-adenosyl-L-methionine-dependent 2-deoxy-scyllo-inosamine dehydrogenase [Fundidesulfovibrio magnetotacticus]